MASRASSGRQQRRKNRSNLLASAFLSFAIVFAAFLLNRKSAKVDASVNPAMFVAQYDTVILPVPVESIPTGTRIKDIRFKNVAFPKQQVPEGALSNVDGFLEAVTLAPLPANLPLFAKNLSHSAFGSNPVVDKIPQGMRAITVRVDATSAVEGWAGSGSIVDVLLVEKDRTTVIAEMVKILSAERSVSPIEGSAAPNVPSTVTLLVTQEQGMAINTAIPLGKIAFALRSSQDKENWASTRFTPDNLRGGSAGKNKVGRVKGYFALSRPGESEKHTYALTDGRWIRTDVVPEGFFPEKFRAKKEPQDAED